MYMQIILKNLFYYLGVTIFIASCNNNNQVTTFSGEQNYVKVQERVVSEREKNIELDSLQKVIKEDSDVIETYMKDDTLNIVSTNPFLYYPFGKTNRMVDIIQKNNFFRSVREYNKNDSTIELYRMTYNHSFIKFYKDDEKKAFEIVCGKLNDEGVNLLNDIRIGMNKKDLIKKFFKEASEDQIKNANVIKIISGLEGIWHIYVFKRNKLVSIYLYTDYVFN